MPVHAVGIPQLRLSTKHISCRVSDCLYPWKSPLAIRPKDSHGSKVLPLRITNEYKFWIQQLSFDNGENIVDGREGISLSLIELNKESERSEAK
jgi:hypothetical protein